MERWQRVSVYSTLALAGALIYLVACGGDGDGPASPTPTEESRTVTSDDGKLTLEVPPGALDEDVPITITSVPLEELPQALQEVRGAGTGYRLEPDGLQFSEPVAVSLELSRAELEDEPEGGITAYGLVSLTEDGERELLDELVTEATLGEETVVARGELSHFSWITRTKGSLEVSLEEVPEIQPVGGTFTAEGHVFGRPTPSTSTGIETGRFLADDNVSTSGDTTFSADDRLGAAAESTGTFKCGQSPGPGTYSLRGKVTVFVDVEPISDATPLTLTVTGDITCVAGSPTPTPSPTPDTAAPTPTPTPEPTTITDPAGDTDCPTPAPAADIRSATFEQVEGGLEVKIVMEQPLTESLAEAFSLAVEVLLADQSSRVQTHAGEREQGLTDPGGNLITGSEPHVTVTDDGGMTTFFSGSFSKGDTLVVIAFYLANRGDDLCRDDLMGVYSCFGKCDD